MNVPVLGPIGLGWLIALLVLVVVVILAVSGAALTRDWTLGLIAALAVARMVP
jgi:hypothetical protein